MKTFVQIMFGVFTILAALYGVNTAAEAKKAAAQPKVSLSMPVVKDKALSLKASNHDDLLKSLDKRLTDLEKSVRGMVLQCPNPADNPGQVKPEVKVDPEPNKVKIDVDDSEVEWQYDYEKAKLLALKMNRPLLACFHTTGCAPCKWAADNVYTDSRVWSIMHRKYVPLWVFVTKENGLEKVSTALGVFRYPTDVIELDKSVGDRFNPVPDDWKPSQPDAVEKAILRYIEKVDR